jgi:hypothetical protein
LIGDKCTPPRKLAGDPPAAVLGRQVENLMNQELFAGDGDQPPTIRRASRSDRGRTCDWVPLVLPDESYQDQDSIVQLYPWKKWQYIFL